MGQNQSKTDRLRINQIDWKYIGQEDNIQIVRGTTGLEGEMQLVKADPKRSIENELQIYIYRKDQDNALVSVYAAENIKAYQNSMCGNEQTFKVITERIPKRFKQFPHISLNQSLYVLSESLRGFKDCYSKIGAFPITDRMLGVNNQGHLKVWFNENFAQNHPTWQRPILQTTNTQSIQKFDFNDDEGKMLKNLLQIIETKCEEKFPPSLKNKLLSKNSFIDAYDQIKNYSEQKNIWIPDKILLNVQNTAVSNSRGVKNVKEVESQQFLKNKETTIYKNQYETIPQPYTMNMIKMAPVQKINQRLTQPYRETLIKNLEPLRISEGKWLPGPNPQIVLSPRNEITFSYKDSFRKY